jgi:hypothetical protein
MSLINYVNEKAASGAVVADNVSPDWLEAKAGYEMLPLVIILLTPGKEWRSND